MLNKLSGWDDTIIAIATPPGIGAIGVIRISGERSFDIMNELFPSKDLTKQLTHTIHVGFIKENGKDIDEVVLSLFKNPKSYTGEDVIEIGCHGSPYIQQQLVGAIINKGARLARHGEFTQRAFLKGKLDLTQAEAVADLIASNTAASQKTALYNIKGGFSIILKELREQLIQFGALIELELDFATEDVEFADRTKFYELITSAQTTTKELLQSFQLGNVIKNGVSVAIIGKPNAGKSTLLNTLLNENRAIVSEIAGTTRDTIEEIINIDGILFRLIDTAGLREHSTDVIELVGIEKSLEKMNSADVVLFIFDAATETIEELKKATDNFKKLQIKYLLVANKSDILTESATIKKFNGIENIIFISAKNNDGVDKLKNTLFTTTINSDPETENIVVSNARHFAALQQVQKSLDHIKTGLDNELSGDLLAPDIRHTLHFLGEITGEVTNEDTLDYIFSKFCIGK